MDEKVREGINVHQEKNRQEIFKGKNLSFRVTSLVGEHSAAAVFTLSGLHANT